ncbi:MAG: phosphate--acyl-ACP acyltransferase, partial [Candidatus Omnitrophota bacterium]
MKIVVDAMGGDYAPENVIAGVVEAIKEFQVPIALVGQQDRVEAELKKYSYPREMVEIIHAPEVVAMDDHAAASIRQK